MQSMNAVELYLDDLRGELKVQFRAVDIDRIVEEAASHLTEGRHLSLETIGRVSFYHYDPYAQLLSKIVRGFRKDMEDANSFVASGLVDPERLRSLVHDIPAAAFARYPALSQRAVLEAVDGFLAQIRRGAPGTER